MENNLYYTPTIEELSINQELYLLDTGNYKAEYSKGDIYPMLATITQLTDYPTIWVKTKGASKGFKIYEVYPDQIGLKYLDQSDIESLGWGEKQEEVKYFELNFYRLYWFNSTIISIDKIFKVENEHISSSQMFRGEVKNKSELIKLMQQLNIK